MVKHFGKNAIYYLPEGIVDMQEAPAFPSPMDLKRKYVVKTKMTRQIPTGKAANIDVENNE